MTDTFPPGLPVYQTGLFIPQYRAMRSGSWELRIAENPPLTPGYWSPPALAFGMPALLRGNDTWMSLSPVEIESAEIGIKLARGHVLIHGLGMGWAAAATALEPAVTAVTVVERDPDVIALHDELDLFAQLPEDARAKLRIVEGDAYTYVPDAPVDLLMPDIWLPLVNDGRIDEVRAMQANAQAAAIYFWGQELEIARHARAAGRAFDAEGIAATIADWNLPIIGTDWPDYPAKLAAAAERWMRGRWISVP
ncbi:hypothetical protein P1X14_10315 [Sphingomonas sp. AOB5]|uniref:hypothetical protein n=1 Tax=Sphingomonas sp. AOB5 TaxID=3034017 RepID=UPI0023F7D4F6|nr:hypothetical protein [Sphingomonas sp. AOB5]MDF7775641.1 hypothetical protein [Sphingomonas sp. AOB5]